MSKEFLRTSRTERSDDGVQSIMTDKRLKVIKEVAPRYGLTVTVLGRGGEKYTTEEGYSGTVPEGEFYIRIHAAAGQDLSEFWKEVGDDDED